MMIAWLTYEKEEKWSRAIITIIIAVLFSGCLRLTHWSISDQNSSENVSGLITSYPEFNYQKTGTDTIVVKEEVSDVENYESFSLTLPYINGGRLRSGEVNARYYKSKAPGKKKLVIILPIYGSSTFPPETIAKHLTAWNHEQDTNVLLIRGETDLFDWQVLASAVSEEKFWMEVNKAVTSIKNEIMDIRRWLDWAEIQPEINNKKVGITGFSVGAVLASITMGIDPRLSVGVFVTGGGELHEIISFSQAKFIRQAREKILKKFGWTRDELTQKLQGPLKIINPSRYAGRIKTNPSRILIFDAAYDNYIPVQVRENFWQVLGRPERITFWHGHKESYFFGMTIFGLNYTDRTIAKFFRDKL